MSNDLIKDYSFGTERSTRIKDYHLKGRMEGQSLILMIFEVVIVLLNHGDHEGQCDASTSLSAM